MTNQPTKDERVSEHLTKAIVTIFEAIDNPHQPRTAAVEAVVGCLMAAMVEATEEQPFDEWLAEHGEVISLAELRKRQSDGGGG